MENNKVNNDNGNLLDLMRGVMKIMDKDTFMGTLNEAIDKFNKSVDDYKNNPSHSNIKHAFAVSSILIITLTGFAERLVKEEEDIVKSNPATPNESNIPINEETKELPNESKKE